MSRLAECPHLVPRELLPDPAAILAELLHAGVADVAPGPAVELSQHAVEWIPDGYETFRYLAKFRYVFAM